MVFLEALIHLIDPSRVHCNKRFTGLRVISPQRTQIFFADGTSAEADVVVGADGIRSAMRTLVVEGEEQNTNSAVNGGNGIHEHEGEIELEKVPRSKIIRTKFTNTTAYRGLVPVERLKSIGCKIDLRDRFHCIVGGSKVGSS